MLEQRLNRNLGPRSQALAVTHTAEQLSDQS